jgi:hypothetical protein
MNGALQNELDELNTSWKFNRQKVVDPYQCEEYLQILEHGNQALEWIFGKMRNGENHWVGAVESILDHKIFVHPHDIDKLCAEWLIYAVEQNIISFRNSSM